MIYLVKSFNHLFFPEGIIRQYKVTMMVAGLQALRKYILKIIFFRLSVFLVKTTTVRTTLYFYFVGVRESSTQFSKKAHSFFLLEIDKMQLLVFVLLNAGEN